MPRCRLLPCVLLLAVALSGGTIRAEVLIVDQSVTPDYYAHPSIRSLMFVSPEARAQAILPPPPVFVAPAPLIWRPPGALPIYPPAPPPGFNRSGAPGNRDLAAYNLARAHAFSQNLYRHDGNARIWYGPTRSDDWRWLGDPLLYPPLAPGLNHPGNRDNTSYLLDRAHRFSQDAYRKP